MKKYWVKCKRKNDGYIYLRTATVADIFFLDVDANIEILELNEIK